jgi:GNAT superfamily N-acetyltransferase
MITLRPMAAAELGRIGEVDRSEHITREYAWRAGVLECRAVDVRARRWADVETGSDSVRGRVREWAPILSAGGVLVGAFEADALVGFAIYRPGLTEDMGQLAALFVSAGHRRTGIGARLAAEVERLARAGGERRLYVSATPSAPTVAFYRSRGFAPARAPHPALFAAEPLDIHLVREL